MAKYFTSFDNLVRQLLRYGPDIEKRLSYNDAGSYFKMGMKYFLGIHTPIDFEKASHFLNNDSLKNDPDANRLLGYLAEINGNYSISFYHYAKASSYSDGSKLSYIETVKIEREKLLDFLWNYCGFNVEKVESCEETDDDYDENSPGFEKDGYYNNEEEYEYDEKYGYIPTQAMNVYISEVLNLYSKDGILKKEAMEKIAFLCKDEVTSNELIRYLYNSNNYNSVFQWLLKSNANDNNRILDTIEEITSRYKNNYNKHIDLQVVNLDQKAILPIVDYASLNDFKKKCDEASEYIKEDWFEIVKDRVNQQVEYESELIRYKKDADDEKKKKLLLFSVWVVTTILGFIISSIYFESLQVGFIVAGFCFFGLGSILKKVLLQLTKNNDYNENF